MIILDIAIYFVTPCHRHVAVRFFEVLGGPLEEVGLRLMFCLRVLSVEVSQANFPLYVPWA